MRIDTSIQDFLRKINSYFLTKFSPRDAVFFFFLSLSVLIFMIYMAFSLREKRHVFIYTTHNEEMKIPIMKTSATAIFAAKTGKTYYFSWCKGGSRVKKENRIFFIDEKDAIESGRTLSKLCQ